MISFNQSTEAPKLGRWFSWNAQAERLLPEYHAQKMVFAFHFDEVDPDEGVPFDDLEAAASSRCVQQQFRALKASDGGMRLCYVLMTTQLLATCKIMQVVTRPCWT